jgi:uncharacterized membrane protein YfcA
VEVLKDVLFFVSGLATGLLSALFGVGGAVVSQPAIRALGVPALNAVSTTLPTVLPGAITGTLRYWKADLIDRRVVAWTVPFGVVASVGGSLLSRLVPGDGHLLTLATAGLLGFTTWRIARVALRSSPEVLSAEIQASGVPSTDGLAEAELADPEPEVKRSNPTALAFIGLGSGLLSGLLGVGGGVVLVPAFSEILGLPLKKTIATSLACVGLFAIPGTITHALLGGVLWKVVLLLSLGIVPGAWIGSKIVLVAKERRLRLAVSAFLAMIAVLYAGGELSALVS